ncbi:MAG TPA: LamG domain-containing protein [Mollicutes bacterium]|nr:LamG domain-containing protein [Mollicutes bacterium]
MNKKGFTLVELLTIIIILSVILVIVIPSISNLIRNTKVESFIKSEEQMIKAAKGYMLLNTKYIPANIGDTTEIKLSELQVDKSLGTIVNPWNSNEKCTGYVLVTKTGEKEYEYIPHLNCGNNINDLSEDKLIAHYTFDDFQEPTENLISGHLTKMTGRLGAEVTLEQNYPFEEYGTNNATRVIVSSAASTSTTVSAVTIVPNSVNEGRTFTTSVKVKNIGVNDVGISNNLGSTTWIKPNEVKEVIQTDTGKGPGTSHYMFNIRVRNATDDLDFILYELQAEEKPYATPYTPSDRGGIVKDYTPNDIHGSLNFSTTPRWISDGAIGGAYEFDGSNDFINCGNDESLNINDALTVTAWVKFDSLDYTESSGRLQGIAGKGHPDSASSNYGWWFTFDNRSNRKSFRYTCFGNANGGYAGGGNNFPIPTYDKVLDNNKWYFLAFSVSQTQAKLYVDGIQHGPTNAISNVQLSDPLSELTIGSYRVNSGFFAGSIDDVRIYNRVLNEDEIKVMFDVLSYKNKRK